MRMFVIVSFAVFLFVAFPAGAVALDQKRSQKDYWYNDGIEMPVWQVSGQYIEISRTGNATNNRPTFKGHVYKVRPLSKSAKPEQLPAGQKNLLSPIYQGSPDPNAPKMILTGDVVVHFSDNWSERDITAFMENYETRERLKLPIGKNIYLFRSETVSGSLELANTIYKSGKVKAAYPDWMVLEPVR